MSIYAHAPEFHIQHHSETENQPETETNEQIAPADGERESLETPATATPTTESAESSTQLCDTFGEGSSQAATDGTGARTSCPATAPAEANLGKVNLPVGESLFGLLVITPFLLHFFKRKI